MANLNEIVAKYGESCREPVEEARKVILDEIEKIAAKWYAQGETLCDYYNYAYHIREVGEAVKNL